MAEQNQGVFVPLQQADLQGPFSENLVPSTKGIPVNAGQGRTATLAKIGLDFLGGVSKGRINAFQKQEAERVQKMNRLISYVNQIEADPRLTKEAKAAASQKLAQVMGADILQATEKGSKGKDKEGGQGLPGHIGNILREIAIGMTGGKMPKGTKDVGDLNAVIGDIYGSIYDEKGQPKPEFNTEGKISGIQAKLQQLAKDSDPAKVSQEEFGRQANPLFQEIDRLDPEAGKKARADYLNLYQSSQNPLQQKMDQAEKALGRKLTDEEKSVMAGVVPKTQHFTPFNIPGSQITDEKDAFGQPIDHSGTTQYRQDEATKLWHPAGYAAEGQGVVVQNPDSPTGWAKKFEKGGKITRIEMGVPPPVGQSGSVTTSVRFIQTDKGIIEVPVTTTRTPITPGGAKPGAKTQAPPSTAQPPRKIGDAPPAVPPSTASAPRAGPPAAAPVAASPGKSDRDEHGYRIIGQKPISAGDKATALAAQGAMDAAARAVQALPGLEKKYPHHFGRGWGTASNIQRATNTLNEDLKPLDVDVHSVAAFLTSVHRARGVGYANLWAQALGDPFVNPKGTAAALRRAGKIAEEVQKRILKHSDAPVTMDQIIKEMEKEGKLADLDKMPPGTGTPDKPLLNPFDPDGSLRRSPPDNSNGRAATAN
jgi:hypothetical protein